jgi:hypothetical protein
MNSGHELASFMYLVIMLSSSVAVRKSSSREKIEAKGVKMHTAQNAPCHESRRVFSCAGGSIPANVGSAAELAKSSIKSLECGFKLQIRLLFGIQSSLGSSWSFACRANWF